MPTVLIFALADDPVASKGERLPRERGAEVVRLGSDELPGRASLSLEWSSEGRARRSLGLGARRVDLDGVQAVQARATRANERALVAVQLDHRWVTTGLRVVSRLGIAAGRTGPTLRICTAWSLQLEVARTLLRTPRRDDAALRNGRAAATGGSP